MRDIFNKFTLFLLEFLLTGWANGLQRALAGRKSDDNPVADLMAKAEINFRDSLASVHYMRTIF